MALILHGYQDFQRVISQSDVILAQEAGTAINAPVTRSLGYVGNLPYLGVYFNVVSNAFMVRVRFWGDVNLSIPLNSFTFDTATVGFFSGSVPVAGPFCTVEIQASAYPSTFDMTVWSAPAEFMAPGLGATDNVIFSETNTAIGASSAITRNALVTIPGFAYWSFHCTTSNWRAQLLVVGFTGTTFHIQQLDTSNARHNELVFLPAAPAQVIITNLAAAPGAFNMALIARPWAPGR